MQYSCLLMECNTHASCCSEMATYLVVVQCRLVLLHCDARQIQLLLSSCKIPLACMLSPGNISKTRTAVHSALRFPKAIVHIIILSCVNIHMSSNNVAHVWSNRTTIIFKERRNTVFACMQNQMLISIGHSRKSLRHLKEQIQCQSHTTFI